MHDIGIVNLSLELHANIAMKSNQIYLTTQIAPEISEFATLSSGKWEFFVTVMTIKYQHSIACSKFTPLPLYWSTIFTNEVPPRSELVPLVFLVWLPNVCRSRIRSNRAAVIAVRDSE